MQIRSVASIALIIAVAVTGIVNAQEAAPAKPSAPRYRVKQDPEKAPAPAPAQPAPSAPAPAQPGQIQPQPEQRKPAPAATPATGTPQPSRYRVKTDPLPAAPAAPAAGPGAPVSPPPADAVPTAASFDARGLQNEQALTAIYRGDFARSIIGRDGPLLPAIMHGYMTSFAQRCSEFLPPNKVEMMSSECATESVTRNGFGVELSRTCVRWVDVPTGLYADPALYSAKLDLDREQASDAFRLAFQLMTSENPIGAAMGLASEVRAATNDMASVVATNACGGPGLKRFSDNLRRLVSNLAPLKLEGDSTPLAAPRRASLPVSQNFERLVEDLIAYQSRTWVVNRYLSGSARGVTVVSRDEAHQPTRIEAGYAFVGVNGQASGRVVVTFLDGAPNCLYFFDAPAVCRTPSPSIVGAYLNGAYAK